MDTSTLSLSDSYPQDPHRIAQQTTAIIANMAQPADAAWLGRLISLTQSFKSEPLSLSQSQSHPQPQSQYLSSSLPVAYSILDTQHSSSQFLSGMSDERSDDGGGSPALLIFIPVLVVICTVLVGLICFLIAMLFMKRRRGVRLTEDGGPLDLSKGDVFEGGVEGVEERWLETVDPDVRQGYRRAKEWQEQYPPSSIPTDITLTQFLSIQEKGVSAWSFEPDYEENLSLYVQSRTEITFLSDGPGMPAREGGGNSVMANLPLPKLNEVYYWEVKMYEKPASTEVAIGLATRPYPSFRLPGWNRFSLAYFASDGFKSHNYPFTAASYGPPLAEGDVLGVGYRPRTGTVFFTRNGRKLEDAYTGLQRLNLFPTIGANGPCTCHVNLGQAGFVFIEANVKKWGLAPMVGTLAPPPAYGSERGSILLDAGYGTPGAQSIPGAYMAANLQSPARSTHSSGRRHRRANRSVNLAGSIPSVSSPLRGGEAGAEAGPGPTTAGSRRRALARTGGESPEPYRSPTDRPEPGPRPPREDTLENLTSDDEESNASEVASSPREHNPPTPNLLDISMHSMGRAHYFGEQETLQVQSGDTSDGNASGDSGDSGDTLRPPSRDGSPPPPGYAPLDPNMYGAGLPANLPEELVNQAIAAMTEAE